MTLSQADLIDCITASLDTHVAPAVQDPMARSQLLTIRYLLAQLRMRTLHETDALAESLVDLHETLERVRNHLRRLEPAVYPTMAGFAEEISGSLASGPPRAQADVGVIGLAKRVADLRDGLDAAARQLGHVAEGGELPDEAVRASRLINASVLRQLEREARWMVSDYSAPRR
jgi:hypothetical protein